MGRSAKDLIVKVIPSKIANEFIKNHHYSGKVVPNSKLHFGVFMDNKLHGVMSYGPPLDKSKVIGLVEGTGWSEMIELNRMAFDEYLPKNSESRAISQSIRLIKKNAPHIKWILSFADATMCGDGTIYRASNFLLTGIKKNENGVMLPNGKTVHYMTVAGHPSTKREELNGKSFFDITGGKQDFQKYLDYTGGKVIEGYQLRYIYLIDKTCKLTVSVIPYEKINEVGAGMYKGEKR